jgi:hypothetical protein
VLEREYIIGPLQMSVHHRLTELTRSVNSADKDELAGTAREQIPGLVEAVRSLLAAHRPDARGGCPTCRPRTFRLFRRRTPAPCRAYVAAHLTLGTGAPPAAGSVTAAGGAFTTAGASRHRRRKRSLRVAN